MTKWIKCSDELPQLNKYVLVIYNGANWIDSDDPIKVYYLIAKRVEYNGSCPNNLGLDYQWDTFGALTLFGHYVDYWMPLPEVPIEE